MSPDDNVPAIQGGDVPHAEEDALREVWLKAASRLGRYPDSPKVIKAEKDTFAAYMEVYEAVNGPLKQRPGARTATPTPLCGGHTATRHMRGHLP